MKKFTNLVLLAVVLTLTGCISFNFGPQRYHEDLVRETWWNYYQRGCYYAEQGKVEEAISDFEICMGIKKGEIGYTYDVDKKRIRTYGSHILDDFYPNRELGICYLLKDQLEKAKKHLEISIEQEPSEKAKLFLTIVEEKIQEQRS